MALTTRERPFPSSASYDSGPWRDPPSRRLWAITGIVVSVGLLIPVLVTGLLLWSILYAPLSDSLPEPRDRVISEITHVYDAKGDQIAVLRSFETNIPVNKTDIPQVLNDAVVAIEDSRFYEHKGVDLRAVARAAWADIQGGGYEQGASTITQQYVRQLYTGSERTLDRKLREVVLAGRLEKKLGKDEILYRYLSDVYLGSGAYGVGAAAQTYFRKPVKDLTVSEAALLAGLIQSPSADEPRSSPQSAEARRQLVLKKMLEQGRIDNSAYSQAVTQRVYLLSDDGKPPSGRPLTLIHPAESQEAVYPYYVDYVRRYLIARYGEDKVYRGGLRVETALDPALQGKAEAAVKATLDGTTPPLDMSLVAMEPKTGLVMALVGGRDFAKSQVNLALGNCKNVPKADPDEPVCIDGGGTGRQPGSAFKPYTLAAAYEKGFKPERSYRGPSTLTLPNCRGKDCTVHNAEGGGYGALDLPRATALSVNTIFAQLVRDVGIPETAEMAHRLGLTMVNPTGKLPGTNESYGHALTLGSAETSPLEMASAFSVFAARGMQYPATPVLKVTDSKGKVLEDNTKRKGRRVLDEGIADHVTEALKGTIQFGTGKAADIGRPNGSAGKTGTSEDYGNAWFVGYTPKLTTAVWMGYADAPKPLVNIKGVSRVYGGTWPARTWQAFMSQALEGTPPEDFPPPSPMRSQVTTTRDTAPDPSFTPGSDSGAGSDASGTPPSPSIPSGTVSPDTVVPPLDLVPDQPAIPPPLSVPPYTGPRPRLPSDDTRTTRPTFRSLSP